MKKLSLVLILLFFGCAKTPTPIESPILIQPPGTWTAADNSTDDILSDWWTTFEDPRMNDLIAEALHHNYDLQAAAFRLDAASAQARIAGAEQYPWADGSINGARRRQNFVGFPIPGSEGRVLSSSSTNLGVSVNVSWEVDLWGRIKAATQASMADREVVRAELEGARQSIAAQTAKAWLAVAEAQQQLDFNLRTLDSYRDSDSRLRRRYEAGLADPLDLRLALSNTSSQAALVQLRRDQVQAAVRQLEILVGRYPNASLENPEPLPELPPQPPAGVPAELVARRPDLAAAEWRLTATDARLRESRASLYPRLTLAGALGTSGETIANLFNPDFFVWSLIGGLVQPIYQGGRLRAAVDVADARLREAAASFASTLLFAFSEVETALATERILSEREIDLAESVEQSQAALSLAETKYDAGLENYITVLESQRRSLLSETELIAVRAGRLQNRVDLHLALGGGFETPPDPTGQQVSAKPVEGGGQ